MKNLLFILIVFILLLSCASDRDNITNPKAVNGVIDLTRIDFNKTKPLQLHGQWSFFWKEFIPSYLFNDTAVISGRTFVNVHGIWNNYNYKGHNLPGKGYATFHLKILLNHPHEKLTLNILDVGTAYKVFINGVLRGSSGIVAEKESESSASMKPVKIDLNETTGSVELVFHVSNYHYSKGGLWSPVLLGRKSEVDKEYINAKILSFFLAGCLLMLGVYHIIVYLFRKKEVTSLYFGILCLVLPLRILSTVYRNITILFPEINHEAMIKMEYLTFYLGVALSSLIFYSLFKDIFKNIIIKIILSIAVIYSAIVIVTPAKVFTKTVTSYEIITIFIICYLAYVMLAAVKRKAEGSYIILIGAICSFIAVINDILLANKIIITFHMAPVGLIALVLSQAAALSKRAAISFVEKEVLSEQLESLNNNLEELVDRKTIELKTSEKKYRD